MRPHNLGIAALGLVAGIANTTAAQVCQGTAPFSAGSARVGAGMQVTDGAKAYGGGLAFGSSNSLFASADVVHTQFDDVDGGANGFNLQGGYSIAMNTLADGSALSNRGFRVSVRARLSTPDSARSTARYGRSRSADRSARRSRCRRPSTSFRSAVRRTRWITSPARSTGCLSSGDHNTRSSLGAGLVFNKVLTIQPSVVHPRGRAARSRRTASRSPSTSELRQNDRQDGRVARGHPGLSIVWSYAPDDDAADRTRPPVSPPCPFSPRCRTPDGVRPRPARR